MQEFQDYVFSPEVKRIIDSGVFVGTKKFIYFFPSKHIDFTSSKIITTRYSFGETPMYETIESLISESNSITDLEKSLNDLCNEFPEIKVYELMHLTNFKIEVSFLGSGINIKEAGNSGWTPFVQKLGKKAKEIKAFYLAHPKYK